MLAVAVALRPAEYEFGAEAPDDSAWELFGEEYKTNPKFLLGESDFDMVTLWTLYRQGHLPDSGGAAEQPAIMLDAFGAMEATATKLSKRGRG